MKMWKCVGVWLFVVLRSLPIALAVHVSYAADPVAGQADGQLVVNKAPIKLKYAYAFAQPWIEDRTKEVLEILVSNIPLPENVVENWPERVKLEAAGTLKCVGWTINPSPNMQASYKIFDSTFKGSPSGSSSELVLDLKTRDEATVAGRMYSKSEQEFFDTTFTFDVTFTASIHRNEERAPATRDDQEAAAKSPQATVYLRFIKAVHAKDMLTAQQLMAAKQGQEFSTHAKQLAVVLPEILPPTVEFQRIIVEGDTATLMVEAKPKDEKQLRIGVIQFIKEDNAWKMSLIEWE